MLHAVLSSPNMRQSFVTRQRFYFAGALVMVALAPFALRLALSPGVLVSASLNSLAANALAVMVAFWMRLSIETYPGNRSSTILLPSISAAHGAVVILLFMARLPYDRVALIAAYVAHLLWAFGLYFVVQRRLRRRIAVVPLGEAGQLLAIDTIDWQMLDRPRLDDCVGAHAIVADFSAELTAEWEMFLADAALAGRVVYQVKQLSESLTGRVEIDHLSENSFGSLVPARGYYHFKAVADWLVAVAMLPLVLPLLAVMALAVRLDSKGPALFRQRRVGQAGRKITIYKFRTMRPFDAGDDDRSAAMTGAGDDRITRVGGFLRRTRLDELPQIFNILKGEMSWIGPRPEAEVLSVWYTGDIPFYRYRHVVRPGISGWAQVNQGHVADVDEVHRKLQYDFFYIKYFSPWLDILIVFRTARTMLSGFGAK